MLLQQLLRFELMILMEEQVETHCPKSNTLSQVIRATRAIISVLVDLSKLIDTGRALTA